MAVNMTSELYSPAAARARRVAARVAATVGAFALSAAVMVSAGPPASAATPHGTATVTANGSVEDQPFFHPRRCWLCIG